MISLSTGQKRTKFKIRRKCTMKKKLLAVSLVAAMTLSLTACGGNGGGGGGDTSAGANTADG